MTPSPRPADQIDLLRPAPVPTSPLAWLEKSAGTLKEKSFWPARSEQNKAVDTAQLPAFDCSLNNIVIIELSDIRCQDHQSTPRSRPLCLASARYLPKNVHSGIEFVKEASFLLHHFPPRFFNHTEIPPLNAVPVFIWDLLCQMLNRPLLHHFALRGTAEMLCGLR